MSELQSVKKLLISNHRDFYDENIIDKVQEKLIDVK